MVEVEKPKLNIEQLTSLIRQRLNSRGRWGQINFQIIAISTDELGRDFRVVVTNESEIGPQALEEARTEVFAPILSQFSLIV